jgi:hypothetical protein
VPGVKVVVNELRVVPNHSGAATASQTVSQSAGLPAVLAPGQSQATTSPAALAMQVRQPASTANFHRVAASASALPMAVNQPMLTQPQVASPAQAPLTNQMTAATHALTSGTSVASPSMTGYASNVPSLQVSSPTTMAGAYSPQSPAIAEMVAPAAVRSAAVARQPMPAAAPRPIARTSATMQIPEAVEMQPAMPVSAHTAAAAVAGGVPAVMHDHPQLPRHAWPSYASHPNYAAVTYPQQYSPTAWPYIGPFYPYPQVPLGWRKVTLEWDDGWWFLDFCSK